MFADFLQHLALSVGAVLIVLLLFVIVAAGAIYYWIWKLGRKGGWSADMRVYCLDWLPPRLHLVLAPRETEGFDRTALRVQSLIALGFQEVGRCNASNYDSLKMVGLVHQENGCGAVVYYMTGLGTWSDVFLPANDGEWILASNVRRRFHFLHLPGERKFHEANKPEGELLEIVFKNRHGAVAVRLDKENFISSFETAFARRADHRLLEPVEDFELRQMLREMNVAACGEEETSAEISEKQFPATRDAYAKLMAKQLASACALDFVRSGISASEWQRSKHSMLVIHDRTPLAELKCRGGAESHMTSELKKKLKASSAQWLPREEFARINASLPIKDRYHKLASVEKPVPADIYRAPLKGFST